MKTGKKSSASQNILLGKKLYIYIRKKILQTVQNLTLQLLLTLQQSFRKQVVVHCVCNNFSHIIRFKLYKTVAFASSGLQEGQKDIWSNDLVPAELYQNYFTLPKPQPIVLVLLGWNHRPAVACRPSAALSQPPASAGRDRSQGSCLKLAAGAPRTGNVSLSVKEEVCWGRELLLIPGEAYLPSCSWRPPAFPLTVTAKRLLGWV